MIDFGSDGMDMAMGLLGTFSLLLELDGWGMKGC